MNRKRLRKSKEQVLRALGAAKGKKRSPAEKPVPPSALPAGQKKPERAKAPVAGRRKKVSRSRSPNPGLRSAGPPTSLNIVPPPPPTPVAGYVERGPDLPIGYGADRIVAMVRDPRCIFVYWELGGGGREDIQSRRPDAGQGIWVLRLEQTAEPRCEARFFDVPVDPAAGNWYLHVEPETGYRVRLGIVLPSGSFAEAAASELLATPAEYPSGQTDEAWLILREEFDRLVRSVFRTDGSSPGGSSESLFRLEEVSRQLRATFGSPTGARAVPGAH